MSTIARWLTHRGRLILATAAVIGLAGSNFAHAQAPGGDPGYGSSPYGPGYGNSPYGPGYGNSPYGPGYGNSPNGPGYGRGGQNQGGVGQPATMIPHRMNQYASATGSGILYGPLMIQTQFGGVGGIGGQNYAGGGGTYGGLSSLGYGSGGNQQGQYSMFPPGFQLHFSYNTLVGLPSQRASWVAALARPPSAVAVFPAVSVTRATAFLAACRGASPAAASPVRPSATAVNRCERPDRSFIP
jgi:hypothetical protein